MTLGTALVAVWMVFLGTSTENRESGRQVTGCLHIGEADQTGLARGNNELNLGV